MGKLRGRKSEVGAPIRRSGALSAELFSEYSIGVDRRLPAGNFPPAPDERPEDRSGTVATRMAFQASAGHDIDSTITHGISVEVCFDAGPRAAGHLRRLSHPSATLDHFVLS